MARIKYVRTEDNQIIVFSEWFQHSDFKNMKPVSAGFISIGTKMVDGYPETHCDCYGESVSLGLKSIPDEDSRLAKKQILGYDLL